MNAFALSVCSCSCLQSLFAVVRSVLSSIDLFSDQISYREERTAMHQFRKRNIKCLEFIFLKQRHILSDVKYIESN